MQETESFKEVSLANNMVNHLENTNLEQNYMIPFIKHITNINSWQAKRQLSAKDAANYSETLTKAEIVHTCTAEIKATSSNFAEPSENTFLHHVTLELRNVPTTRMDLYMWDHLKAGFSLINLYCNKYYQIMGKYTEILNL